MGPGHCRNNCKLRSFHVYSTGHRCRAYSVPIDWYTVSVKPRVGSCLSLNDCVRVKIFVQGKHASLLHKCVIYVEKSFEAFRRKTFDGT
jgi:hypothetical protein